MYLKIVFLISVLLILLTGCSMDDDPVRSTDIESLQISDDFNFETERWVNVELTALYTGTFYLKDMNGKILFKGTINQDRGFSQKIKLATSVKDVKIEYYEVDIQYKNYEIRDNEIIYSFIPQLR